MISITEEMRAFINIALADRVPCITRSRRTSG